jgi:hypothetical protein
LFFLHIIAAAVLAFNTSDNKVKLSMYVLVGFYALIYVVYSFFRKQRNAQETFSLIMVLLYINFWFRYVGIATGIIFVLIYLFVALVQRKKTTVLFNIEGIHLTRIFKTVSFPWTEMDNVILKDDLLTIDFKSNKIIQVEIAESDEAVDEEGFNMFCTEQLEISTPK